MQKGLIGVLGVLLLFLAAANIRLSSRAQVLEEQLALSAKRTPAASAPAATPLPAAGAESPPLPAIPVAPTAASERTPEAKPAIPPGAARPVGASPSEQPRLKIIAPTFDPGSANGLPFTLQPNGPEPSAGAGPRSGFLGISGMDVPGGGVRIQSVVSDSVALRSGLLPDDVILEYNGEPIDTLAALTQRIQGGGEGSPVSLRIRRNGVEFYQGVQLGARTPAQR